MKKKKVIKLVIIISIIIVAALLMYIFIINKSANGNKLANLYEKLSSTQTYLFEMERNDENKIIMAKKNSNAVIDQYSESSHTTTIVKDEYTYLVLHNREEYYVYGKNNVDQNILADGLKDIQSNISTTGSEKIKGKKYYYEEYNGSTIFMISTSMDITEGNVKTRFFFDNNGSLAYIKTMTGENQELLKVNLQFEVNDSIFEIPSNYAEY